MFKRWKIFTLIVGAVLSLMFGVLVQASTSDQSVSVGLTVPSSATCGNGIIEGAEVCDGASLNSQTCTTKGFTCGTLTCAGDCLSFVTTACSNNCGPGPTGDSTPPVISAVVSVPGYTTSTVSWTATDNVGVTACTFGYSTDSNYGTAGTVAGTYGASLTGLLENTTYNFKITCRDAVNNSANQTGSFTTLNSSLTPDTTGPVISNVVSTTEILSATVGWSTNENATGQVDYGLDTSYANSSALLPLALTQSVTITGLLPNTVYHFRITATDASGNQTRSGDYVFKTKTDAQSPANVTNLRLTTTSAAIVLNWDNPDLLTMPDFSGVKIVRKIGSHSASISDGTLVYNGSSETFTDSGVVRGTTYFYTVFSYDTSGNNSSGVYVSGVLPIEIIIPPKPEVCNNNIDDDEDGFVDCADSDCASYSACHLPGEEICNNTSDDDGDGLIDCADPDCAATQFCQPAQTEICNDNLDNDGDGQIDCADSDCATAANCHTIPTPACRDGQDNDGDGLIDTSDPGCASAEDTDEYNSPEIIIPPFAKINLSDLIFAVGNRNIILRPQGTAVSGLAGAYLSVGVPSRALLATPTSLVLKINGTDNLFTLDSTRQVYYADVSFPQSGEVQAFLEINYGSQGFDAINFGLNSVPYGAVNGGTGPESGVTVSLYNSSGASLSMAEYGQSNPVVTGGAGQYGWFVPNGNYYLATTKDGYYDYRSQMFSVNNNIVNRQVSLILKPKPILEEIDPDASFGENAKNIAKNLFDRTSAMSRITARAVSEAIDNPQVEKAAKETVAPATMAVVGVGTAAMISWANLLALLRFLFFQPLLLVGRRRREKWGQIYNSLNKLPVDLATVRLVDAQTNRVVRSRVTDSKGRYVFIINPGKYRIEAFKSNFIFPSSLLKDFREDGRHTDIYHGELIEVTENNAVITANIPLDQMGVEERPRRLRWQKFGRRLQTALSWSGLLVAAVSLYIAPVWYMWVLLGVHVVLLGVFYRLAVPGKAKGWGMVYDVKTRVPISNVVARLFDSQFNKLVATEITDNRGRYSFLAGDSRYYVTYDRNGYEAHRTDDVDLTGKEEEAITVDVGLQTKFGFVPPPPGSLIQTPTTPVSPGSVPPAPTAPVVLLPPAPPVETPLTAPAPPISPVVLEPKPPVVEPPNTFPQA